jgi:hypothetical protein
MNQDHFRAIEKKGGKSFAPTAFHLSLLARL